MDSMNKGTLKKWNGNKGFGFIRSGSGGPDIFIHISALRKMSRHPIIGDVIFYELHMDNNGKARAVNAIIEGVAMVKERKPKKLSTLSKRSTNKKFSSRIIPILVIVLIGSSAYSFVEHGHNSQAKPLVSSQANLQPDNSSSPSYIRNVDEFANQYSCSGKTHCSQMRSCDEAIYYQNNCPNTEMDGDLDGIPCERQWCGR
ncbi:excalibur calcium-binding domain-containing protein [Pseudomonadota bacterium]